MAGQENQQYTVLYGRLSQEDERVGESNSIQHQDSICVRAGSSIGANRVYLHQNGFILWEPYLGTYGI